jgi:hypothetical protein
MKQEDKELLLKDLCARLPYGVKVTWDGKHPLTVTPHIYCAILSEDNINNLPKLLLRPMSSMTEEERKEYKHLVAFSGSSNGAANFVDWLNKKMFAYRTIDDKDMFKLGIALKALDDMYKIKEK